MDAKKYAERIQQLPRTARILILWGVVGVVALVLGFQWVQGVRNAVADIENEDFTVDIPKLDLETPKEEIEQASQEIEEQLEILKEIEE